MIVSEEDGAGGSHGDVTTEAYSVICESNKNTLNFHVLYNCQIIITSL